MIFQVAFKFILLLKQLGQLHRLIETTNKLSKAFLIEIQRIIKYEKISQLQIIRIKILNNTKKRLSFGFSLINLKRKLLNSQDGINHCQIVSRKIFICFNYLPRLILATSKHSEHCYYGEFINSLPKPTIRLPSLADNTAT